MTDSDSRVVPRGRSGRKRMHGRKRVAKPPVWQVLPPFCHPPFEWSCRHVTISNKNAGPRGAGRCFAGRDGGRHRQSEIELFAQCVSKIQGSSKVFKSPKRARPDPRKAAAKGGTRVLPEAENAVETSRFDDTAGHFQTSPGGREAGSLGGEKCRFRKLRCSPARLRSPAP